MAPPALLTSKKTVKGKVKEAAIAVKSRKKEEGKEGKAAAAKKTVGAAAAGTKRNGVVEEEREKSEEDSADEFAFLPSRDGKRPAKKTKKPRLKMEVEQLSEEEEEMGDDYEEGESREKRVKPKNKGLICPLCDLDSSTVRGLTRHLQIVHKTTPTKQDLFFLCSCGVVTQSRYHEDFGKCPETKRCFTLIKKEDVKLNDACIFCETRPGTIHGYCSHLSARHQTTLLKSGIYLVANCGLLVRSSKDGTNHGKCRCRGFTVHKN